MDRDNCTVNEWAEYEAKKRKLVGLSEEEYLDKVKEIVRKMNL